MAEKGDGGMNKGKTYSLQDMVRMGKITPKTAMDLQSSIQRVMEKKCDETSWSANTMDVMRCPYCGAELPPPGRCAIKSDKHELQMSTMR